MHIGVCVCVCVCVCVTCVPFSFRGHTQDDDKNDKKDHSTDTGGLSAVQDADGGGAGYSGSRRVITLYDGVCFFD